MYIVTKDNPLQNVKCTLRKRAVCSVMFTFWHFYVSYAYIVCSYVK